MHNSQKLFVKSIKDLIKIIKAEKVGEGHYFFSETMRQDCIDGTLKTLEDFKDCENEEVLREEILLNELIKENILTNKKRQAKILGHTVH
jgi:hypothetical protein